MNDRRWSRPRCGNGGRRRGDSRLRRRHGDPRSVGSGDGACCGARRVRRAHAMRESVSTGERRQRRHRTGERPDRRPRHRWWRGGWHRATLCRRLRRKQRGVGFAEMTPQRRGLRGRPASFDAGRRRGGCGHARVERLHRRDAGYRFVTAQRRGEVGTRIKRRRVNFQQGAGNQVAERARRRRFRRARQQRLEQDGALGHRRRHRGAHPNDRTVGSDLHVVERRRRGRRRGWLIGAGRDQRLHNRDGIAIAQHDTGIQHASQRHRLIHCPMFLRDRRQTSRANSRHFHASAVSNRCGSVGNPSGA